MSKLEDLKSALEFLGATLRSDGIYFRLIMSDDIDNMADIRERAKAGLNWLGQVDKNNGFFHGIAVRPEVQDKIDDLVRNFKPQLLEVIDGGEPNWHEFGIDIYEDKAQNAYLVLFNQCCAGFYVSRRTHRPRHERKKTSVGAGGLIASLKHQAMMAQTKPVDRDAVANAKPRRKKFTTIRHHVN